MWSPQSRNNKLTLTESPDGCGLVKMAQKTSGNSDSPYGPMANMIKTEQGISIMVFICWTEKKNWDMKEAELEK